MQIGKIGIGTSTPGSGIGTIIKDNGALHLADSDVAHGITGVAPTTTFGQIGAISETAGGLSIGGLSDTDATGLSLAGVMGSDNPTDATPCVSLAAYKKNGTTVQALGALESCFKFWNSGTAILTILGDGKVGLNSATPGYDLVFGNYNSNISLGGYVFLSGMYNGADAVFGLNVYADVGSRVLKQSVTNFYGAWIRMYYNTGIFFGTATSSGTAGDTLCDPAGTTNEKMNLTAGGDLKLLTNSAYLWFDGGTTYGITGPSHFSYGSTMIRGIKTSYAGLGIYAGDSNQITLMYAAGGHGGMYNAYTASWHYYWNHSNLCLGIAGSTTSASYEVFITGSGYASGGAWTDSDGKFKKNVDSLDGSEALDKLNRLRPVSYNWKKQEYAHHKFDDRKHFGFISQEVASIVPEAVQTITATRLDETDNMTKITETFDCMKYSEFIPLLVQAVQEIDKRLKRVEAV